MKEGRDILANPRHKANPFVDFVFGKKKGKKKKKKKEKKKKEKKKEEKKKKKERCCSVGQPKGLSQPKFC